MNVKCHSYQTFHNFLFPFLNRSRKCILFSVDLYQWKKLSFLLHRISKSKKKSKWNIFPGSSNFLDIFTIWKHLNSITTVSSMCKSCRYHVKAVKFVLKRTAMHVQNSVSHFQTNTTWSACETHADSWHIQRCAASVIFQNEKSLVHW